MTYWISIDGGPWERGEAVHRGGSLVLDYGRDRPPVEVKGVSVVFCRSEVGVCGFVRAAPETPGFLRTPQWALVTARLRHLPPKGEPRA